MRRCLPILMILLSASMLPAVAADPPPGAQERTQDFCDPAKHLGAPEFHPVTGARLWTDAICDDINRAMDSTGNTAEWLQSSYEIEMVDLTHFNLNLLFSIHEMAPDTLGLDSTNPVIDLLGLGANEGIPADYIRNFISLDPDVAPALKDNISGIVRSTINNTFGNSTEPTVDWRSGSITIGTETLQCLDSEGAGIDSADEDAAVPPDAFNPPLCLQISTSVETDASLFSLGDADVDVERTFQGLLTMGGEVSTSLPLNAQPGHRVVYDINPPGYGTMKTLSPPGILTPRTSGIYDYNAGVWTVDALSGTTAVNQNAEFTFARRPTSTRAVDIDTTNESGLVAMIEIDARNEAQAVINFDLGISYIDMNTLDQWNYSVLPDAISLPWMTSDGLRMVNHSGIGDLDDFLELVPMESMSGAISGVIGQNLTLSNLSFQAPNATGGLNFSHSSGSTCTDPGATYWCVDGPNAMDGTYPIYLHSESAPFEFDLIDMILGFLGNDTDLGGFDPAAVSDNDLAALLNVMTLEMEMDASFLGAFVPTDLPATDVVFKIRLPSWIRSSVGDVDAIHLVARSGVSSVARIGITGPNPYDYGHAICEQTSPCIDSSEDVVCLSSWASCVEVEVEVNLHRLEFDEWSQSVEIEIDAGVTLKIYRIALPGESLEAMGLKVEALPSDLVRQVAAMGDKQPGGLLGATNDSTIDIPVGSNNLELEISNAGLQSLTAQINDMIAAKIQSDGKIVEQGLSADFTGVRLTTSLTNLEKPTTGNKLSDATPITIGANLEKTVIKIAMTEDGGVGLTTSAARMTARLAEMLATGIVGSGSATSISGISTPEQSFEVPSPGLGKDQMGMDVRPAVTISASFPPGLGFGNFESSSGNQEITETDDGRQRLVYRMPLCKSSYIEGCSDDTDKVTFSFTIGFQYVIAEVGMYLAGVGAIVALLIVFKVRRKKKRKARLKKEGRSGRRGKATRGMSAMPPPAAPPPPAAAFAKFDPAAYGGGGKSRGGWDGYGGSAGSDGYDRADQWIEKGGWGDDPWQNSRKQR